MSLAYDGTHFHGFARQSDIRTVGGERPASHEHKSGSPLEVVCAGRTDTGVHATAQVVHVDLPSAWLEAQSARRRNAPAEDLSWLARSVSAQLGSEVAVTQAWFAGEGFDARHSALARRYRYDILNTAAANPLLARTAWFVPGPLDLKAMRTASDMLIGEHDFGAFCRRPPDKPEGPICRRVLDCGWTVLAEPTGVLRFEIEATAFCHQMVRSLVGSLLTVGEGRMTAADIHVLLGSGDRAGAARPAPPQGLCLIAVRYGVGDVPVPAAI
jgi:tRNA pseudouridine38-40 synthase